jgi:phosphatidylserine/phosphatidylglycerophosphate/cardiolipin synthase-like enzyme
MNLASAIAAVRRIELQIDTTLEPGYHEVPAVYQVATQIRIPTHVTASIRFHIEREAEHLRIVTAKLSLTPAIRILNPRRALHPAGSLARNLIDRFKDSVADLLADGALLDPATGEVELAGVIDVLRLAHQPIPDEVHPHVNLDLDQLLLSTSSPASPSPSPPGPLLPGPLANSLLRAFAQFVRPGTVHIELEADPLDIAGQIPFVELGVPSLPVQIALDASFEFTPDGALRLETAAAQPTVRTALGTASLSGKLQLAIDPHGSLSVEGTGRLVAAPGVTQFAIAQPPGTRLPFVLHVPGGQVDLAVAGSLHDRAWQVTLGGDIAGDVELESGATFATEGLALKPSGAGATMRATIRLLAGPDGVRAEMPAVTIAGRLAQADMDIALIGPTPLELNLTYDIALEQLQLELPAFAASGVVKIRYGLKPAGLLNQLLPQLADLGREIALELQPGGRGRLDGPFGFLEELVAPLLEFVGPHPGARARDGAPAADLGVAELGARINELTTAIPRTGNAVRILHDASALDARLALIRSAKRSIAVQTPAVKDDDDGNALAAALEAAVRAGVEVRVLVDGLGELDSARALGSERPIYQRLRQAGIRLGVQNNPHTTGLDQLLEDVSVLPELAGDSYQDLQLLRDPFAALAVFLRLSVFATANGDAATAETRKRVSSGLARLLLSSELFRSRLTADQASVPHGLVNQLVYAAQQVVALGQRMSEQIIVVDAAAAITGGRDLDATDGRDPDIEITGPAAVDLHAAFLETWNQVTGDALAPLERGHAGDPGVAVQIVTHRPRTDAAHRIAHTMTEAVRATATGQRALITSPRFLPLGSLGRFHEALCDACRRGVDVRVLTNSERTAPLPGVATAAVFAWRELLAAGCRIFVSTRRPILAGAAVFGGSTSVIGSWACDDRSETLTSQVVALVYDAATADQLTAIFDADTQPDAIEEVKLESLAAQRLGVELRSGFLGGIGRVV